MENLRPDVLTTGYARHLTFSVLYPLTIACFFLFLLAGKTTTTPQVQAVTVHPTIHPTSSPTPEPTVESSPTPFPLGSLDTASLASQRQSIITYIHTIFGKDASIACAIAFAEDGFTYKGERYFKTSAIHASNVETSIGLFQINLKSKDALVHYNQVPGNTLQEKIDWLSDPYNNTLFAYWMYATHKNFSPWSVYTDGTYLLYMQ